jgi:hypothetical protein
MMRRFLSRLARLMAPPTVQPVACARSGSPPVSSQRRLDLHVDEDLLARYAEGSPTLPASGPFPLDDPWPDDPGLSPAAYDRLEVEGGRHLPFQIIRAFRPITFEQLGFPTRITETAEILRYADWNTDGSAPRLFARGATYHHVCYVNAFTADEAALTSALAASVSRMTAKRCGRAVRPFTTMINALTPFRIIQQVIVASGKAATTTFEVGPGMAYLGPLLASQGHRYRCVDVTQAFCLWQHHMLRWTVGRGFVEMTGQAEDQSIPEDKPVVNLPWWLYPRLLERPAIQADFVYSNANLGEMTADARRCVLEVSFAMLRESPIGLFFYIGPGHMAQCSIEQLHAEIQSMGFTRVEELPFAGWVARKEQAERIAAVFARGIEHHDPSRRAELYPADVVMRIPRSEAPLDIAYTRWSFGWEPPYLD